MKKILIVGGTGFLGFHYARFCLKKKYKVFSLSRNKPKKIRHLKNVNYFFADISKKNNLGGSAKRSILFLNEDVIKKNIGKIKIKSII